MNRNELIHKAVTLSGRPARKNKFGIGALRWLSIQLDVHPTTVLRWIRMDHVPEWAAKRIGEIEREALVNIAG